MSLRLDTFCTLALALALASLAAGQPQLRARKPTPRRQAPRELVTAIDPTAAPALDTGVVAGQKYFNNFFGLELTFPEEWFVISETGKQQLAAASKPMLKGKTPQETAMLEQAVTHTLNLFTVRQYLMTPPGQSNPNFILGAEPQLAVNVTPLKYLKSMITAVLPRFHELHFDVEQEPVAERLAGRDFGWVRLRGTNLAGAQFRQEYHVTVTQGYVLFAILSYQEDSQRAELGKILASLKFASAR